MVFKLLFLTIGYTFLTLLKYSGLVISKFVNEPINVTFDKFFKRPNINLLWNHYNNY